MSHNTFTLYLARHGQTEYNRRRLMQGRSIDAPLNETGEAQAGALSDRFEDVHLDAVYASPLKRARQTAEAVAGKKDLDVQLIPELAEMAWGELEGRPIDDLRDYLKRVGGDWSEGLFDHRVGGGESILEVQERARSVVEQLQVRWADGGSVLAITHGRFLRVLLTTALIGYDLRDMDRFEHANAGVYRLDRETDGFRVVVHNDTAHLTHLQAS